MEGQAKDGVAATLIDRMNDCTSARLLHEGMREALIDAATRPIVPLPHLTDSVRTPWGGARLSEILKPIFLRYQMPLPEGPAGESWQISGQMPFPNIVRLNLNDKELDVSITAISERAPESFFGKRDVQRFGSKMPFLVKLLNSADRLSVQVHPNSQYAAKKKGARSKTEAWIILQAEKGAGLYLGLREKVTRAQFERALRGGEDVSVFLNFVEAKSGDAFFIPAGTPHAIGAGLLLIEFQETSETTYRYYDWGRKDETGRPRELHIDDALASTNWDTLRGDKFLESIRRNTGPCLINEPEFVVNKIDMAAGQYLEFSTQDKMHGLTIVEGEVVVRHGSDEALASKYQSVIVPAVVTQYRLELHGNSQSAQIFQIHSSEE